MIKKSFELNNKIVKKKMFFILWPNEEAKKEALENIYTDFINKNIQKYEEKEILDNQENFY